MEQVFRQLPLQSKVWIYQSSRELTEDEARQITALLHDFVQQWTSHSRKVIAKGAVLYNRFVVLAADETAFTVSGCSIDSSVNFIRQLERQFNLSLFDRLAIAYRDNGKIHVAGRDEFQHLINRGIVTQDTIVFNNLVSTVHDFQHRWEVPLSESWHVKYFVAGARV